MLLGTGITIKVLIFIYSKESGIWGRALQSKDFQLHFCFSSWATIYFHGKSDPLFPSGIKRVFLTRNLRSVSSHPNMSKFRQIRILGLTKKHQELTDTQLTANANYFIPTQSWPGAAAQHIISCATPLEAAHSTHSMVSVVPCLLLLWTKGGPELFC